MSGAEVVQLLGAHDENVCVRLYRRKDGTVMTKDCPKGIRSLMTALGSWIAIAAVALLGFFLCRNPGNSTSNTAGTLPPAQPQPKKEVFKGNPPAQPQPKEEVFMGKLCPKDLPPIQLPGAPL
jgi:hypothetical protein